MFLLVRSGTPNAVEQPAAVALTEELAAESPDEKQGKHCASVVSFDNGCYFL